MNLFDMFSLLSDNYRKWTPTHFMGRRDMIDLAIPSDSEDSEGDNSQEECIPESCLRNSNVKGQSVSVSRVTLTCVFIWQAY